MNLKYNVIYKDVCIIVATNKFTFDIYFRESIDMMHKKLVFRQLSRYTCTRRI